MKFKGQYPDSWTKEFRNAFRASRGNKCERCNHLHDPENGYALTIHHLDNDKSNCSEWNLAALCQRCHLHIQGKVNMFQDYALEHSEWMKPHVTGMKNENSEIAVLFVKSVSVYKYLGCDAYDLARDARNFKRDKPIVAHPPCRAWSAMKWFARPRHGERRLAVWAVLVARRCGGVVEHPKGSSLWKSMNLPKPGEPSDKWGGYTVEVDQCDFGHKARKRTWLYIVGTRDLPPAPTVKREPTHVCHQADGARRKKERPKTSGRLPVLPKHEREATPIKFAQWLIEIARRTQNRVAI